MLTENKGLLILEDGSRYEGFLLNNSQAVGEVVFTTGMTGYQEVLTDPSYCGQIIVMTYPLIGNYGVNPMYNQSTKSFARGFIVSELCEEPSNWLSENTLTNFLLEQNIPCLYDVDTRAITRKIRDHGTMHGIIVPENTDQKTIDELFSRSLPTNLVEEVSTKEVYTMGEGKYNVAVLDFGIKRNILRSLVSKNCRLTVYPANTPADEILSNNPDGVFLSNGPGNPKNVPVAIKTIQNLLGRKPIFGICLGHQLLALALGADSYKLKFGHRGSNHPVKDLLLKKVIVSSQNHGYAVDEKSLKDLPVEITNISANDGTVEGFKHNYLPVFSVQYHPEASPGPDGHEYLFERFLENMNLK